MKYRSQPSHFTETFLQHRVASGESPGNQCRQVEVDGLGQSEQQMRRIDGCRFQLTRLKFRHSPNDDETIGMPDWCGHSSLRLILRIAVRFRERSCSVSLGNGSCEAPPLELRNWPGENNAETLIKSMTDEARFNPKA